MPSLKQTGNQNLPPAIVIGVDVSALNVVRSLGRRGIDVFTVGADQHDYGAVSRYATFVSCQDLNDGQTLVSTLLALSRKVGRRMVLICTSDLHVLHVSRNREALKESFAFVLPEHEVIETLMDKRRFSVLARSSGFPVPVTLFSGSAEELEKIAAQAPYPCAVKPLYRTAFWSQLVPPEKKVMRATSPRDLIEKIRTLRAMDQHLIIQEWIPGGDEEVYFCLAYLDRESKALALLTGRKLRQYPPLTGVTSLAETIRNDDLADLTKDVLSSAGCTGLCSLECKYDAAEGIFKITEPTVGRVDLQEGISAPAGVDIPFIAYQDAAGMSPSVQNNFREGLKWINEPFELNSFLSRSRNGRKGLPFLHYYKGPRSYAVTAADDPGPFMRFMAVAGRRGLRYLTKSLRHRSGERSLC
ncbi:conserved hypothetical protein [Candidatus Sulfobium mesophilum]|uniref:ATP-grasp domain-containing protein n=1 Tax=Candidatus Sulfobium mesophilum TaxID=2016548 RepID=A0A2U3QDL8_9BACT|nr:conserved hypothetical protein [Candidatus Sulfobium mesophilum]